MKPRFSVTAGMLAAFALAGAAVTALAHEIVGKVVRVQDGDTLTILIEKRQVRVRLLDIDAPELGQAFGRRSRESLAQLCAARTARVGWSNRDRYQRILGSVRCGDADANAEQVRRGMAWVFVKYAPKDSPLYPLQAAAQAAKRGLWADAKPVSPWEWRRRQRHARQARRAVAR